LPHLCGLERAVAAAAAARSAVAAGEAPGVGAKKRPAGGAPEGPSLGADLKVHKSGLERAKEAAEGEEGAPVVSERVARQAAREASAWAAWEGQPIAALGKRKLSQLEVAQAAWKKAAARAEKGPK